MGEEKDLGLKVKETKPGKNQPDTSSVDSDVAERDTAEIEILETPDTGEDGFRQYCRSHFEQIFDTSAEDHQTERSSLQRNEIWELEKQAKQDFQIRNPQIAQIFLEELINFSLEKIRQGLADKLEPFVENIYNSYFYISPNISNDAYFEEKLRLAAKMISIPELEFLIGRDSVGEIMVDISFGTDKTIEIIIQRILTSPIDEAIAMIQMIRNAAVQGRNMGDFTFEGIERLEKIVAVVQEGYSSRLVKYSCDICLEQIEKLWNEDFSQSTRERESIEQRRLSDEILSKVELDPSLQRPIIIKVAEDFVAALDRNMLPINYGKIDFKLLEESDPAISAQTIYELEEMLEIAQRGYKTNLHSLLDLIQTRVVSGILGHQASREETAKFLSQNFDFFPEAKFLELLEADQKIRSFWDTVSERYLLAYLEAEDKNKAISEKAIEYYSKWLAEFATKKNNGLSPVKSDKFFKYQKEGNQEGAFSIAQNNADFLAFLQENELLLDANNNDVSNLISYFGEVERQHDRNKKEANDSAEEYIKTLKASHAKYADLLILYDEIIQIKLPEILSKLLEKCLQSQKEAAQTVKLNRIEAVDLDKGINPFGKNQEEYDFLKVLWTPGMIRKINLELNGVDQTWPGQDPEGSYVDIRDLNVASQVQLLRFLMSSPDETFDQLQDVLRKNQDFAQQILQSFLSCSEDMGQGQKIIEIVQTIGPDSRIIFEKYSEVVERIAKIEQFLQDNFSPESAIDSQSVVRELLTEARNSILSFDVYNNREIFFKKIEDLNVSLLTLKATFLYCKKSGILPKREEILLQETVVSSGQEIPEEEKDKMREIAKKNWQEISESIYRVVAEYLEKGLADPNNRFYRTKYDGRIIAFQQFTPQPDGSLYASSNNINPDIRGAGLNTAINAEILAKEAESAPVRADVWAANRVFQHYLAGDGFVACQYHEDFHGTGESFFGMLLDKKNRVIKVDKSETVKMAFDPSDHGTLEQIGRMFEQGYVMTAVSFDKKTATLARAEKVSSWFLSLPPNSK